MYINNGNTVLSICITKITFKIQNWYSTFGYFPLLVRTSLTFFRRSAGNLATSVAVPSRVSRETIGKFRENSPHFERKFGQHWRDYNRADERNEEFFPLNNFRSCISAPFVNVTRPGSCLEVSPVFRFFLLCPLTNRPFQKRLPLAHVLARASMPPREYHSTKRPNYRQLLVL